MHLNSTKRPVKNKQKYSFKFIIFNLFLIEINKFPKCYTKYLQILHTILFCSLSQFVCLPRIQHIIKLNHNSVKNMIHACHHIDDIKSLIIILLCKNIVTNNVAELESMKNHQALCIISNSSPPLTILIDHNILCCLEISIK